MTLLEQIRDAMSPAPEVAQVPVNDPLMEDLRALEDRNRVRRQAAVDKRAKKAAKRLAAKAMGQ